MSEPTKPLTPDNRAMLVMDAWEAAEGESMRDAHHATMRNLIAEQIRLAVEERDREWCYAHGWREGAFGADGKPFTPERHAEIMQEATKATVECAVEEQDQEIRRLRLDLGHTRREWSKQDRIIRADLAQTQQERDTLREALLALHPEDCGTSTCKARVVLGQAPEAPCWERRQHPVLPDGFSWTDHGAIVCTATHSMSGHKIVVATSCAAPPPAEAPPVFRVEPNGPPCPACGFAIVASERPGFAIEPEPEPPSEAPEK